MHQKTSSIVNLTRSYSFIGIYCLLFLIETANESLAALIHDNQLNQRNKNVPPSSVQTVTRMLTKGTFPSINPTASVFFKYLKEIIPSPFVILLQTRCFRHLPSEKRDVFVYSQKLRGFDSELSAASPAFLGVLW